MRMFSLKFAILSVVCLPLASAVNSSDINIRTPVNTVADTGLNVTIDTVKFKLVDQGRYPNEFTDQAQFNFEKNGVRINIQYFKYQPELMPTLEEVSNATLSQLSNNGGMNVAGDQVTQALFHNNKAATINASLQMPFMDKQINYRLMNIVNDNQRWLIIASYKSCDQHGQRLTEEFFNNINFVRNL